MMMKLVHPCPSERLQGEMIWQLPVFWREYTGRSNQFTLFNREQSKVKASFLFCTSFLRMSNARTSNAGE